jgi:hypothetical protein
MSSTASSKWPRIAVASTSDASRHRQATQLSDLLVRRDVAEVAQHDHEPVGLRQLADRVPDPVAKRALVDRVVCAGHRGGNEGGLRAARAQLAVVKERPVTELRK